MPLKFRAAAAAFCAGWTLMMLEMLAGRLMAPWFGQSVRQWGALIGCVMTAMTAGYWFGGRAQNPRAAAAAGLAVGGAWSAATPVLGKPALSLAVLLGPTAGLGIGAALLAAAPAFALAAVSPACVAALAEQERAGAAAGRISALGSLGCIGGTFFASFFAIPYIGVAASYAAAALVCAVGFVAVGAARWDPAPVAVAAVAGLLALGGLVAERAPQDGVLAAMETDYNSIRVIERDGKIVLVAGGPGVAQSVVRRDGGPTGLYYDALPMLPALSAGGDAPRVLALGVAGGSGLTAVAKAWPQAELLGVELDPGMTAAGRAHFGLTAPVEHADARVFVETDSRLFDMALADVYSGGVAPFHAATQEFFVALSRRLSPGGVVVVNACRCGGGDALPGALAATMAAAFPSVLAADAPGGNVFLFGWREADVALENMRARLRAAPGGDANVKTVQSLRRPTGDYPVLTDNLSDVEFRTAPHAIR